MRLSQRILACTEVIEMYQAEKIGLVQALLGLPLTRAHFAREHEWHGYSRGWEEGRAILEKGEGA